ncbi:hypothetical protein [Candidatus Methylomirabilis sp.]|uniref:Uncharacterized protein n=1 Tax=Candidatus Methylomirabilis tolerans TaxID=3123416 RepID=A0AAJ1ESA1_9BACT|nr:hypothetical protein [Candidatus Methylomirabilis sp.]
MGYRINGRDDERQEAPPAGLDAIEVEAVEPNPILRGDVRIPNYFKDYWQPILGHKAAATYEMILRFAYGDSETCTVSLHRLAASLGMDRNELKGRERRDVRAGRASGYHERGTIEILCDAGLIEIQRQGQIGKQSYLFRVVKNPPPLTDQQVSALPCILQRAHKDLIDRCRRDLEKRRRMQRRPMSGTAPRPDDSATQDRMTPSSRVGDGATQQWMTASPQTIHTNLLALPPHTEGQSEAPLPERLVVVLRDSPFEVIKPDALLQLLTQYGAEKVTLAIDVLTGQYRGGNRRIAHPLPLLRKTLRAGLDMPEDYVPYEERIQRDEQTRRVAEESQALDEIERRDAIERRRLAEGILRGLPQEEQEAYRRRAIERVPAAFHGIKVLTDHALYQLVIEERMEVGNEQQAVV